MNAIEKAGKQDIPELLRLVRRYWEFEGLQGDDGRVTATLEALLDRPDRGGAWLARVDGTAAGSLLAVYVFSLEHLGLTAEIDEFYVSQDYRARGLGSGLLRAAEAEFAGLGCTNVSLQLARDNHAARAFYHHHGYAERAGFELLDKMLAPVSKPDRIRR